MSEVRESAHSVSCKEAFCEERVMSLETPWSVCLQASGLNRFANLFVICGKLQ